jgi:hypothetical protein
VPLQRTERDRAEDQHKGKKHAHIESQLVGGRAYIVQDRIPRAEGADDVESAVNRLVGVLVDDDGVVGVPEKEGRRVSIYWAC